MRKLAILAAALGVLSCGDGDPAPSTNGSLSAQVESDPWHLTFVDDSGRALLEEASPSPTAAGPLGFRTAAGWFHATRAVSETASGDTRTWIVATDDPDGRRIEVRIHEETPGVVAVEARVLGDRTDLQALGVAFASPSEERFLGFGQRANAVDQTGNTVENYVSDGPWIPGDFAVVASLNPIDGLRDRPDSTYFPVPWLVSTRGHGLLIDNAETSYFRLRSERADAMSLEVTGVPEDVLPRAVPDTIRFRVFAGPRPADALRRFTEATGRQPRPAAPWVFGPWYQPGGSVDEQVGQVEHLHAADAPLSVVQTYLHYLPCGDHVGRRESERERVDRMHALGVAITTYFNPMICSDYLPPFAEAAAAGALMTNAAGDPYVFSLTAARAFDVGQFDFANEAGREHYARLLAEAAADGHDGWMEDFGEYTPLDSRTADGRSGVEIHNPYPTLFHCAAWDFVRGQDRPIVRFQRSGWTGSAPCAQVVWGGDPTTTWDFDGLASVVKSALGMGLSGISYWGSDIGGFFSLTSPALTGELLKRWVQVGAVSGVMRMQRNGLGQERPQVEDPDQIANWRRYAKLRTQLYPYLAARVGEYEETGLPILRHLALVWDDARAREREDEFLFGPDVLVAPVLEPAATTRTLYLPPGEWIDLWRAAAWDEESGTLRLHDATVASGGRDLEVPAPLEELPLFVRAGAVLPLLPADVDTLADFGPVPGVVRLADRSDELRLLAFPRGDWEGRFGDGGSLRASEGRSRWELEIRGDREIHFTIEASLATLERSLEPSAVEWDGRALAASEWQYDAERRVLLVRFRGTSGRLVVRG